MEFLSDDPTYPAVALGLLALGLLVAVKVTQQGKYLFWAGGALVLLATLLLAERAWVTEEERIEEVVNGLARAVEADEPDLAAGFLAPDCVIENTPDHGNAFYRRVMNLFTGKLDRDALRGYLADYRFEYLKVARLRANAGRLSGRGTAEFVVHASLARKGEHPMFGMTPPSGMGWSFGLVELEPHVWKIARMTPGRIEVE